MAISKPLVPRDGHTLQVLIVARISGCQNQKELSLEDQVDHAKQEVAELYEGPCEFHVIATKGLDQGDRHLRKAIAYKAVQMLRRWEKERKVARVGKAGSAGFRGGHADSSDEVGNC